MYDIRIAGVSMPQSPDASITVTGVNPAFDKDRIDRAYTYTINIPVTPPVRRALSHPDRIDSSLNGKKYPAEIYISGIPFKKGEIKITNANKYEIKGVFRSETIGVMESLGDVDLRGIFETLVIPQTNEPTVLIGFDYPAFKYYIIIDGISFQYQADGPDEPLDNILQFFKTEINLKWPGLASEQGDSITLSYSVLPNMNVQVGQGTYFIDAATPAEQQQQNFLDYISNWITNGSDKISFPVIHNFNLYQDQNFPGWSGVINYIRNGTPKANDPVVKFKNPGADPIEQKPSWAVSWIPFLRVSHILKTVASELGMYWDEQSSAWTDIDISNLLQFNNHTLDESSEYYDTAEGKYFHLNHLMQKINLNNHVPDSNGKEYLSNLCKYLCLWAKREGNVLELKKIQDQFDQYPIDWTAKADDGYEIEEPEEYGYSLEFNPDKTDTKDIPGQLNPYFYGDEQLKIKTEYRPPHWESRAIVGEESDWLVPVLLQPGSTEEFGLGENDTGLKLFYDRGFQPDSSGVQYPMGGVDIFNIEGTQVGDISLDWHGANGLHETLWKGLARMKVGRTVTKTIRLSIHDLVSLLRWENPMRYIRHEMGTMKAVVKKVKFKVTREHILPAEVEFVIPAN